MQDTKNSTHDLMRGQGRIELLEGAFAKAREPNVHGGQASWRLLALCFAGFQMHERPW